MRFTLEELAAAVDGVIEGPFEGADPGAMTVDGVSIDTRTIEPGNLFIPLVAERDGHAFIPQALDGGAATYLTSAEPADLGDEPAAKPRIRVADTGEALIRLGTAARARLSGPVIGITGSVGKTSVKDLTKAACSDPNGARVWASARSFNNEIGVPLTLANAPDDAGIVVVEMGARGHGHIALLCRVARPTVGIVTTVALAHSELFGSIEAVAEAKGELIESLPADGTAVLNGDDPLALAMRERTEANVITFGRYRDDADGESQPDVAVADLTLDGSLHPTFTLIGFGHKAPVTLPIAGAHMALNAAAAVAAAVAVGVPFERAADQVTQVQLSPWRMEVKSTAAGALVVNDAYNANPTSMRAALDTLRGTGRPTLIAVVGEMAELGEEGPEEHLAIAEEATAAGVRVIAVDSPAYGPGVEHAAGIPEALTLLGALGEDSAILVKGSRVAGLERLAARLLG